MVQLHKVDQVINTETFSFLLKRTLQMALSCLRHREIQPSLRQRRYTVQQPIRALLLLESANRERWEKS